MWTGRGRCPFNQGVGGGGGGGPLVVAGGDLIC